MSNQLQKTTDDDSLWGAIAAISEDVDAIHLELLRLTAEVSEKNFDLKGFVNGKDPLRDISVRIMHTG